MIKRMIFIETAAFTEDIKAVMPDEIYAGLQQHLASYPDSGDTIQGTGGVRKIRWNIPGTGKRGGARVIYYWRVAEGQILMLLVYTKNKKDDLSAAQKKLLKKVVENW